MSEWAIVINVRNRRIVFGRPLPENGNGRLTVADACCCIYYPSGGDMGLAVKLPSEARIGPVVPAISMDAATSEIIPATDEAVSQWMERRNGTAD